jgi:hypothetical protein
LLRAVTISNNEKVFVEKPRRTSRRKNVHILGFSTITRMSFDSRRS